MTRLGAGGSDSGLRHLLDVTEPIGSGLPVEINAPQNVGPPRVLREGRRDGEGGGHSTGWSICFAALDVDLSSI